MKVTTCNVADLAEFIGAQRLTLPKGVYARHLVQVTTGQARAVWQDDDPAPVAIAGLYEWADRPAQAWFMVRRDAACRRVAGIATALRRCLRDFIGDRDVAVVTLVNPGNRAGEVLARFIGFEATEHVGDFGRIWIYGGRNV